MKISARELTGMLALVSGAQGARTMRGLDEVVSEFLPMVVAADVIGCAELDCRGPTIRRMYVCPGGVWRDPITLINPLLAHHPIVRNYRRTGQLGATRLSDYVDQDEWMESELYRTMFEPVGLAYQLSVSHTAVDGVRVYSVHRSRCDFEEREVVLLDCMREQLQVAYQRIASNIPALRGGDLPSLTSRERDVLELLATGLPAQGIAVRLTLSPRSVQKVLQRLYVKLEVHDRLTAINRSKDLGFLP